MYEKELRKKEATPCVVALDLGTSKILGIVGEKIDKKMSILAMEQISSIGCIRRGCIYKMEDTVYAIRTVIDKLNIKLDYNIKRVYVGVGGQALRTECFCIKKEINGLITEETLQHLEKEIQVFLSESVEVLEVSLSEYYLDGEKEENPKNIFCKEIEAKYQLLLGRASLKQLVKKTIEEAGIEVAGFIISPLATAEAILSSVEKENGCALVEIGAGVTYLSIYKERKLKYLVTIPLGGNVITKDITKGLNIAELEADSLKIDDGSAVFDFDKKEEELLDIIIEARMNEIVSNVVEQIKKSGYLSSVNEGIILTGGGSMLKYTDKLFTQKINYKKVYLSNAKNPMEACAWGIFMLGEKNCISDISKDEEISLIQEKSFKKEKSSNRTTPKKKKEGLFGKLTRSFFDFDE